MMRLRCPMILLMVVTCTSAASAQHPQTGSRATRPTYRAHLQSIVDEEGRRRLPEWLAQYKELHAHPELSLQEKESAAKIAAFLSAAGYTVTQNVGGHGVVGVLQNGAGPTVLIRGDMDALPITEETGVPYRSERTFTKPSGAKVGVMHACGHDVHQTCLVGTAQVLATMRDRWRGTVMIIAQPAEEIGLGARMMIEDGLFERFPKADYCLALHVSGSHAAGTIAYTPGWALANVDSVDITIHGRGGHGSRPNEAVDPIVAAAQVVIALQTIVSRRLDPTDPGVITVGSIHGGSKHNIIPDTATMQVTVRSYTDETRRTLLDGIRDITMHTARAMGCETDPTVTIREEEFTPATYNDPALAAAAADIFRHVVGPDRVEVRKPVMGGEDFGRFSKHLGVPGLIYFLGSVHQDRYDASVQPGGPPLPSLHSSKYYPDPEPTIIAGVRSMTALALALLGAPE